MESVRLPQQITLLGNAITDGPRISSGRAERSSCHKQNTGLQSQYTSTVVDDPGLELKEAYKDLLSLEN